MEKMPSKPHISKEELWTDNCPACKSGNLEKIQKKKFFGLFNANYFFCDKCGAKFVQVGNKFKFTAIFNKSNPVWQEYGRKSLTAREWKNIAHGGMSDAKQMEADIEKFLEQLRKGVLPTFESADNPEILLKRNENLILNINYVSLSEPRSIRTSSGGYSGPSFRITKGVYFRMGSFKSSSESHDVIKTIDTGTLALTNKRLIFLGDKRTVNIDMRKIVSIHPYKDAVAIMRERRQKPQYFTGIDTAFLKIQVEDRVYNEPLSGIVLMYLIEGLAKNIE